LAPEALILIMTNPEDRIAYAVNKYTNVQAYGFCDGLWDFKHKHFEPLMGIRGEDLYLEGYGINHAVWITEMRQLSTGENVYEGFVKKARDTNFEPFGMHLYEQFGLWPHENDEHYGEYFSNACEFIDCKGYDFDGHLAEQGEWEKAADSVLEGSNPIATFWTEACQTMWDVFGDSPPSAFIEGVKGNKPRFIQNVNVANNGTIAGLPDDMIVEVPGVAVPSGLYGVKGKALPFTITSFLAREGAIQRLSAEAAFEGSREKAILALELDSHITSNAMANRLLDAFIEAHSEIIPQKQRDSLGQRSGRISL
jgi:alpha-galactosidase/6-phospho-beta-glucosidase family protein